MARNFADIERERMEKLQHLSTDELGRQLAETREAMSRQQRIMAVAYERLNYLNGHHNELLGEMQRRGRNGDRP